MMPMAGTATIMGITRLRRKRHGDSHFHRRRLPREASMLNVATLAASLGSVLRSNSSILARARRSLGARLIATSGLHGVNA
jgi:hypothetical protein